MDTLRRDRLPQILSIVALVISVMAIFVSWRTYSLSYRPYLGITAIKESYENGESSPTRINWAITIKNTGNLPATGKVSQRKVFVSYGKEIFPVPMEVLQDASLYIMPGGQSVLTGDVPENDHVPLRLILEGKATITDSIRISYELSKAAWWRSNYFYEAKLEYHGGAGRRFFTLTVVDGD
jgi:hypothetical protein